ncbi:hypothetical protein QFC21_001287 [Naganishia friedmannii]|uniref:Uncharacterized protein n=1 Tax=Naganishia friedmannii TaxID=89922 RepID=A0ACC2W490_9TREE|nr:hypothetical protein QFC21_001287 [Naganishia friedmannii]
MSEFVHVPVLLLYAINSLALKAYLSASSQGTVRHIAWLQAVVWTCLGVWTCIQRRDILGLLGRQLRYSLVGGLILFVQSSSCILAMQHHNLARDLERVITAAKHGSPTWLCRLDGRQGLDGWCIKSVKRVVEPKTIFLDDTSILGCAFASIVMYVAVAGLMSSPHSTIRRVPGNLTSFTAAITTIISISASLVPAASAPKSLLVGLWPDANAMAIQQKPEFKKETIGFWPATLILGLMTMSVPQQAPSLYDLGFVMLSYLAIIFAPSNFRRTNPLTRANPRAVNVSEAYASAASPSTVMKATNASGLQQLLPVGLRSVLKDVLRSPESSKIFYFLLLNLAYMFVQLMWGVWTNSLGLISDAIHMAFDCVALGVGLFASVMATWESDATFTYGYVLERRRVYSRVQTLSGFANGVFLILISIFIIVEGLQRIANPPQIMNMKQLLLVSAGGLGVNLWGMYATGHHHHHGHGHHDHGHDHGDHHHGHGHSANMHGVFLHVLADTMGSVGVIISTLLINWTGYAIFDPIASLMIASLIIASVIPLIMSSAKTLSLELESGKVDEIRNALAELASLDGVESYGASRFWPKDEETIVGSIHIQLAVSKSAIDTSTAEDPMRPIIPKASTIYADPDHTRELVEKLMYSKIHGLEALHIQLEAGDSSSFCTCRT